MASHRRLPALLCALFAALVTLAVGASSSTAAPAYTHNPHLSCNPHANAHSKVHCDGDGFLSHDVVKLTLHTTTYNLTTAHANAAGTFGVTFTLPAGVTGTHTITATGTGGAPSDSASTQILISALGTAGTGGNNNGTGGLSSTGVAILSLGVIALALIVGGSIFVFGGRRKRVAVG